ncbi:hypothetical protein EW146_g3952 [Bondarzewia mesenterica]|uniref:Zinc-finger domain-containing protein n=1 Tax=Bondarzewia mesenterica TaxID=1095465 RepID=A0A4S4LY59_9AGAM|nr:hypothetical protein EW146_g3952 [Bondarzewia mesenterica]
MSTATPKRDIHVDTLKENTPLRMRNEESMLDASAAQVKRKRSARDIGRDMPQRDSDSATKTKKQKVSGNGKAKTVEPKQTVAQQPSNATDDFPHGSFYCHQCAKKRDSTLGIQCTFNTVRNNVNARCRTKYCKACLLNRYGQQMDEIKSCDVKAKSETVGHVKDSGYYFKCPRCDDSCNCRECRKAKGLEPTGNLTVAAKRIGAQSVAKMLLDDATMTGILPGKGKQTEKSQREPKTKAPAAQSKPRVKPDRATKTASSSKLAGTVAAQSAPKPKRQYIRKLKPLPQPRWRSVPVPPAFDLETALARIEIREFVLRFAPLLDISRAHLDELEEIGGRGRRVIDLDEEDVDEVVLGWVTESCVKAVIVGLLGLLVESDTLGKDGKKVVTDALKGLKPCGANLSKVWGILAAMRSSLSETGGGSSLAFPNPLPPPAGATVHTTRSGQLHGGGIYVANAAQFVPVLKPLVEAALDTVMVRNELDRGMREAKELVKAEREQIKVEKEKWDKNRKSSTTTKVDRENHRRVLHALEQAHQVASNAYMPRFSSLGTDHEGRVYFALSSSIAERDAAFALLDGNAKKGGKARGRAIISEDERRSMNRWGWFIGIWGRRPEVVKTGTSAKGKGKQKAEEVVSDEEDEDITTCRWWAFWQPEEIRKLAEWIAMKNGIAETGKVGKEEERRATGSAGESRSKRAGSTGTASQSATGASVEDAEGVSSRASSPLSEAPSDEVDEDDDELSPLTLTSDSEDEDGDISMRTDAAGRLVPSKQDLKVLVKNLTEYAEILDWRVWRMEEESEEVPDVKGKGKAK